EPDSLRRLFHGRGCDLQNALTCVAAGGQGLPPGDPLSSLLGSRQDDGSRAECRRLFAGVCRPIPQEASLNDLCKLSASEAVALLRKGEVSPLEMIDAAAARIAETDPVLNAMPILCL